MKNTPKPSRNDDLLFRRFGIERLCCRWRISSTEDGDTMTRWAPRPGPKDPSENPNWWLSTKQRLLWKTSWRTGLRLVTWKSFDPSSRWIERSPDLFSYQGAGRKRKSQSRIGYFIYQEYRCTKQISFSRCWWWYTTYSGPNFGIPTPEAVD